MYTKYDNFVCNTTFKRYFITYCCDRAGLVDREKNDREKDARLVDREKDADWLIEKRMNGLVDRRIDAVITALSPHLSTQNLKTIHVKL